MVHALAKLRIHTDESLEQLYEATKLLGEALRKFKEVMCDSIVTSELAQESQKRLRLATKTHTPGSKHVTQASNEKVFNICTWKIHALLYYVADIIRFGTTDSFTTAIVSCLFIFSQKRKH